MGCVGCVWGVWGVGEGAIQGEEEVAWLRERPGNSGNGFVASYVPFTCPTRPPTCVAGKKYHQGRRKGEARRIDLSGCIALFDHMRPFIFVSP